MGRQKNMEQRETIVSTAYRLFCQKGYENITMKEIATECDISPSLLQHYFNTKDSLVVEIFFNLIVRIYDYLDERFPELKDSNLAVAMFYRLFYEVLTANGNKLLDIYYVILSDAELLSDATNYAYTQHNDHWNEYTMNDILGVYMLNGMLSQLFTVQRKQQLPLSAREIVNFVLLAYFGFLGKTPDEAAAKIKSIDEKLSPETVEFFVKDYISSIPYC